MKRKNPLPVFKEYVQGQVVFLPTDIEAQIPPKHLVRIVNSSIEKMDLSALLHPADIFISQDSQGTEREYLLHVAIGQSTA
jgi:hypothetical protein